MTQNASTLEIKMPHDFRKASQHVALCCLDNFLIQHTDPYYLSAFRVDGLLGNTRLNTLAFVMKVCVCVCVCVCVVVVARYAQYVGWWGRSYIQHGCRWVLLLEFSLSAFHFCPWMKRLCWIKGSFEEASDRWFHTLLIQNVNLKKHKGR